MWKPAPILAFALFFSVRADVTVYLPFGSDQYGVGVPVGTAAAAAATYTGAAAYNPVVLKPPDPPQQTVGDVPIRLPVGNVNGLSKTQLGNFLGFSIELSVSDTLLGKSGTNLQPTFLNLMANLRERTGQGHIVRVGGNSQEKATLIPEGLPNGGAVGKTAYGMYGLTDTPTVVFSPELIYAMSNITGLTGVQWYMGIPFNDTNHPRLAVAEYSQRILGSSLLGLQLGNEPDLYPDHDKRPKNWTIQDYMGEFQVMVDAMNKDVGVPNRNLLVGPSVCCNDAWTPDILFDAGYLDRFVQYLSTVAVQHYPAHNCNVGTGKKDSQTIFPNYLDHNSSKTLVSGYHNAANRAVALQKPFVMLETGTGSCGGFPGVSDSFGAAIWGVDYALQMASANFSHALMHIGGQSVYYNAFTPPPSNQTSFRKWTIGPMYYSSLVVAEIFGSSGQAQIMDISATQAIVNLPAENLLIPAYAIYENGAPVRLALFNFITDPSGVHDYNATVNIGGGNTGQPDTTPQQVWVRYLRAPSVASKGAFYWAGQTFGDHFASNGRPQGNQETISIVCTNGSCSIPVYAPSIALVFLNNPPRTFSTSDEVLYTTTVFPAGKGWNTAVVDQAALQTSNGRGGRNGGGLVGSTSHGSASWATGMRALLGAATVLGGVLGGAAVVLLGGYR